MGANSHGTGRMNRHKHVTLISHMLKIDDLALTNLLTTIDGLINKCW